jgi:hypothetical protein
VSKVRAKSAKLAHRVRAIGIIGVVCVCVGCDQAKEPPPVSSAKASVTAPPAGPGVLNDADARAALSARDSLAEAVSERRAILLLALIPASKKEQALTLWRTLCRYLAEKNAAVIWATVGQWDVDLGSVLQEAGSDTGLGQTMSQWENAGFTPLWMEGGPHGDPGTVQQPWPRLFMLRPEIVRDYQWRLDHDNMRADARPFDQVPGVVVFFGKLDPTPFIDARRTLDTDFDPEFVVVHSSRDYIDELRRAWRQGEIGGYVVGTSLGREVFEKP